MMESRLNQELSSFFQDHPIEVQFKKIEHIRNSPENYTPELSSALKSEIIHKLSPSGIKSNAVFTSVSHTRKNEETWLVVAGSIQRIGVDLEISDRKVHPRVLHRLISPEESKFDLNVLEFWVVKEAAFKVKPINPGTFVSQYPITDWNRMTGTGKIRFPLPSKQECNFKLIKLKPWLFAFAKID